MSPELKAKFAVQALLPLEIKLHLERLKLMELIHSTSETKTLRPSPETQAEMQAAC
jgi:hypothetical protein